MSNSPLENSSGGELSWSCPWCQGRKKRQRWEQSAVPESIVRSWSKDVQCFRWTKWVPWRVAGKGWSWRSPIQENHLPRSLQRDTLGDPPEDGGDEGQEQCCNRTSSGTSKDLATCCVKEPALGCAPHIRWPDENYRHHQTREIDFATFPLIPYLPLSPTLKKPRAVVGRI